MNLSQNIFRIIFHLQKILDGNAKLNNERKKKKLKRILKSDINFTWLTIPEIVHFINKVQFKKWNATREIEQQWYLIYF